MWFIIINFASWAVDFLVATGSVLYTWTLLGVGTCCAECMAVLLGDWFVARGVEGIMTGGVTHSSAISQSDLRLVIKVQWAVTENQPCKEACILSKLFTYHIAHRWCIYLAAAWFLMLMGSKVHWSVTKLFKHDLKLYLVDVIVSDCTCETREKPLKTYVWCSLV